MVIPELYKKRDNGEHQYICPKCRLEIFFLGEFEYCPRCGVMFNWKKVEKGRENG